MSNRVWPALVAALSLVAVPGAEAAGQDVLIRGATVVTMNAKHRVIPNGRVLVSGSKIAATWGASDRPRGLSRRRLRGATIVQAKRDAYEWNEERPDELERLVENPASALQQTRALGLYGEAVKFDELAGLP